MSCYARGPVCPYECMPCDECPASKPEYAEAFEVTHNSDAKKVKDKIGIQGSGRKSAAEILNEMQELETREDMIDYLRSLPKKDIEWPEDKNDNKC